jgi:hypothetical protein
MRFSADMYTRMSISIREKLSIKFFSVVIICIFFVLLWISNGYAQKKKPGEYEVKAAFLYNFLKFIEWPDKDSSYYSGSFNICVFGEDPLADALESIQDETIGQKQVVVKHVNALQQAKSCHVLFISSSEEENLEQITRALKGMNILLVGDTEGYAQKGVLINFYMEQNKVRFEINADAVKWSGLRMSSKLLNLAKIVHDSSKR